MNYKCTFGKNGGLCTGARWSFCPFNGDSKPCPYKKPIPDTVFDAKKTVLPLRPEERDTPNHDIHNQPTYRNR